jgi:hypothetical protein
LARAIRIGSAPVARDDLHARMLLEPRCQDVRGSFFDQVDHAALFEIDQNRPVGLAALACPIIDTKNAGRFRPRQGSGVEEAENRGAASDQTTSIGQTRPSAASRGKAEILQASSLRLSPSGRGGCEPREALGEDLPSAPAVETAEASHGQAQADRSLPPGKIDQRSTVGAVNLCG